MDSNVILFNKEGFTFTRITKNNYNLNFTMENKYIILPKIIDFNLMKLIYDLNTDVYEKVELNVINDYEAVSTMLIKHLFEDLGLPQRYSFINIHKFIDDDKIIFKSKSNKNYKPSWIPENAELMSVNDSTVTCNVITEHKIEFIVNILFEPIMVVPPFAEKMVGMILFKIFKRVKQFIENIRM